MMRLRLNLAGRVLAAGLVAASAAAASGLADAATPTTTVAPSTVAPTTVAATTVAATTVAATTVAPTTVAATTTTVAPVGISDAAIRDAKVGWSRFVADNFATPNAILDPCPLLTVEDANAGVAGLGLIAPDVPYGVSIYRDATGVGIIGIVCGNDLANAASPAGATLINVEVTLLDGQAVFPQYVVRVGGNNTPIERAAPELGGDMFGRCRTDAQFCAASWHSNGLIVTVKLDGPRTADSEAQVRQLLVVIAPQVVANLAAVTTAS